MSFDPKDKKPKKKEKDNKKADKPKQLSDADMDKVAGGRSPDPDGRP
jgi:hypothetical protein